jgi:hypothetical protein
MAYPVLSFDELLQDILQDYSNQEFLDENGNIVPVDISQGTLIFMKSACYAAALWGIQAYITWGIRQIFPQTCDGDYLDPHGYEYDLPRLYGETDAAYLARIEAREQEPPAGGNQNDYEQWALAITNVAAAYVFDIARGLGTVDVVLVANSVNTGSQIPSNSAWQGNVTSVSAGELIDSTANFTAAGAAVPVGARVKNTVTGLEATVTTVTSGTVLVLSADIFPYINGCYTIHFHSGTTTSLVAGKLENSAAAFSNATWTIKPGDLVQNYDKGTSTTVVSVDSATQLTLAADIFTAVGQHYVVRGLCGQVKESIDQVRPVTASSVLVKAPTVLSENVTMVGSGPNWQPAAAAADVAIYLDGLAPLETLAVTQLIAIAINNGAADVTVSAPAENVVPTAYQMIRPGVITVS